MSRYAASLADWLDNRTGFRALRRHLLDEPLPAGTAWWFTLGSVLLFGLGVQVVTGIALALYYAPTPDHAWDSVRFVDTGVRGGAFLRGLHHWGASVVVVAAVLHLVRVVFFGSYRKPRELNWIVGLLLLQVILAFGLTGYLLPWDQRAYWATVVAINISKLTPIAGEAMAALLRGGPEIGALTLTRWYAVHVLVLPALLAVLVTLHLYLMKRHGISGPVRSPAGRPSQLFFPYQAARDLTMATAVGILLAVLAWQGAPELEPPADPTSSDYVPRPDWYFFGLFQLLKYFPGRLEVIGALMIPGAAMTFLALLPWLDRARTREARRRLAVLLPFTAGAVALVTLTVLGARDRPPARNTAWNVRELGGVVLIETSERCTKCHGPDRVAAPVRAGRITQSQDWLNLHVADPEVIAPGLRLPPESNESELAALRAALARMRSGAPPAIDEHQRTALALFNRFCIGCHKIEGVGGTEGPDLTRAGGNLDPGMIERRIINPLDVQIDAEMPSFAGKIGAEDIRTIAIWLGSRR